MKYTLFTLLTLLLLMTAGCQTSSTSSTTSTSTTTTPSDTTPSSGTPSGPLALSPVTVYDGSVSAYGNSYYQFSVVAGQTYEVIAKDLNISTNIRLSVYDNANYYSGGDSKTAYGTSSEGSGLVFTASITAQYYIKLQNENNIPVSYKIHYAPIPYPNDGTSASPISLTPGTVHSGGVGIFEDSYYTIDIIAGQTYEFNVSNMDVNASVQLFDLLNIYRAPYGSATNSSNIAYYKTPTTNMSFPFGAYGESLVTTTYDILVKPITIVSEGSTVSPVALTVGTTFHKGRVKVGEYAYYAVDLIAGGFYVVDVNYPSSKEPMSVYVYNDASFTSFVASGFGNTVISANALAGFTAPTTGTYYIKAGTQGIYDTMFDVRVRQ